MNLRGTYISSNDDVLDRDHSHSDWLNIEVDDQGASPSG